MLRSETAGNPIKDNPRHTIKDPKFQTFTRITSIQDDENMLAKRISMLRAKQIMLDEEINQKQKLIDDKRDQIIEQKRSDKARSFTDIVVKKKKKMNMNGTVSEGQNLKRQDDSAPLDAANISRQVRSYQAMIDNMLKQSNEYDAQKKHLKTQVDKLRREKDFFSKILKRIKENVKEYSEKKNNIEKEEEEGLKRLQDEMKSLMTSKRTAAFEDKRFGKEFGRVYHYFEQENEKEKLKDVFVDRNKIEQQYEQQNNIKAINVHNSVYDTADSPLSSKKKQKQSQNEKRKIDNTMNDRNLNDLKQDVDNYDNTFKQLMQETNTKDINEILQTFEGQEEENYGMFKYLHELNADLERLKRFKEKLSNDVEILKQQPIKMQEDPKVQKMNKYKIEIAQVQDKSKMMVQKHKDLLKILQSLKVSIPIMFERIGCYQEEYLAQLGENFVLFNLKIQYNNLKNFKDIDEDGIIKLLGVIERRTNDILQMQNDIHDTRHAIQNQQNNQAEHNKNGKVLDDSNLTLNQQNQEDQLLQKITTYTKPYQNWQQWDPEDKRFDGDYLREVAGKECKKLNKRRK